MSGCCWVIVIVLIIIGFLFIFNVINIARIFRAADDALDEFEKNFEKEKFTT
jgi:predicted metal-binding membrane protein